MAEPLRTNIIAKDIESRLQEVSRHADRVFKQVQSTISQPGIGGGQGQFFAQGASPAYEQSQKAFENINKTMTDLIKEIKESTKVEKQGITGTRSLTRAMAFAGTGTVQTLSALSRGDILGAVSGGMNVASGVAEAFKTTGSALGKVGLGIGAAVGIPLALAGMGAQRVNQSFAEGFANQQKVQQMQNVMGMGGGGLFGGSAFQRMAQGQLALPGQAAGVGLQYMMAGGTRPESDSQMRAGIRLFLAAQKNFGASAEGMGKAVGEMVHWGTDENLTSIFKDAGRAAFSVGGQGFWAGGQWGQAASMLGRTLTFAGGGVGAGGYAEIFKALQIGQQAKYTPTQTAQVFSAAMQGLQGAFGSPQQMAFLSGVVGLSPMEMQFPTAKGAMGTLLNFMEAGPTAAGFQNPLQLARVLAGTPLAPLSNLMAKRMFPGDFEGIEAKKIQQMSKADYEKEMIKVITGEHTKEAQIAANTKKMADAMSKDGLKIVNLLTTMDMYLQSMSVGMVKQFTKMFPDTYIQDLVRLRSEQGLPIASFLEQLGLSEEEIIEAKEGVFGEEWQRQKDRKKEAARKRRVEKHGIATEAAAGKAAPIHELIEGAFSGTLDDGGPNFSLTINNPDNSTLFETNISMRKGRNVDMTVGGSDFRDRILTEYVL